MDQEIKITAEPQTDPTKCKFTVDRPVYPDGSYFFTSKEKAKGSPLAEALFELEGVTGVLISNNIVTVTRSGYGDWMPLAKQVGATIRAKLKEGGPLISEELKTQVASSKEVREKIQQILDYQINPAVAGHGGYVELIDVKDNIVYLRMGGGCQGCGAADITLKQGIATMIREEVPQIVDVLDVTDHAAGQNPYYSPYK